MASANQTFQKHSEAISVEHQELMQRLQQLDSSLDKLVCYAEVYADLASSADVVQTGRWLAGWVPEHFAREEQTVLASVARLGPEFAAFSREMKQQHKEISVRLESFCRVANHLEDAADLEQTICKLKEQGKSLTTFMATHMGAEERKFSTVK
jgi:hemerythrin HHE cation binding domain-containing protein